MSRLVTTVGASVGVCLAALAGFTVANAQPADDAAAIEAVMGDGEAVYEDYCAVCHGGAGEGGEGPRLVEYERLEFVSATVGQIIEGGAYMPAFGNRLNDAEIAAVATYVRNSWGNAFGLVTEEQVGAYR